MKLLLSCLLLAFAAAASAQPAVSAAKPLEVDSNARREFLVGRFFEEAPTKEGGRRQEIIERKTDGSYVVQFRVKGADGQILEQSELGLWGISGPIYFTITQELRRGARSMRADPTQATYYDAYSISKLTQDQFRCKSVSSGDEYTLKRVPESFSFPAWSKSP